jgi:hypothetical protein
MWMKNHLVSNSICNIVKIYNPPINDKYVGLTIIVGDTMPRFTNSISKTITIGGS